MNAKRNGKMGNGDPKRQVKYVELEGQEFIQPEQDLSDRYAWDAGTKKHRQVLLHSPMGLRIALQIDEQRLEIWISPQAKKTVDADLRNFSNRDDHTSVFDRIALPGQPPESFERCEYDPFHSVLYYGDDRLHLVPLVDEPGVLMWSESGTTVDLKSDKGDCPARQEESCFSVVHPDRGHTLEFAAVAGKGQGAFVHQLANGPGRSLYTRIKLEAGQPLIVGGEIKWERPAEQFERLLSHGIESIVTTNERRVTEAIGHARVQFKARPELQAQYEMNQRVLYAGMDHGGAMPGSWRKVYYLLWHMDGAMASAYTGMAGWPEYLERWARFEAGNPTVTETPVPGRFFGQIVDRHISKQEEWGLFWTTWSVFTHWTQTGDDRLTRGAYRRNLLEALDWLERLCYEKGRGAFGTYYRGENPFEGSHDFGYDAAIGVPRNTTAPSRNGKAIHRWFTRDFNLWMFNVYVMMGAMWPDLADVMDAKAANIQQFLGRLQAKEATATVELEDGTVLQEDEPVRHSPGAWFMPQQSDIPESIKAGPHYDVSGLPEGEEKFAHHVLLNLAMMDSIYFGDEALETFLDVFLPQCRRSGAFLRMAGTMPENVNCADGSYHDNRPYLMPIGMLQATLVGRGLFRLPFGLAVRANDWLDRIKSYGYQGGSFDVVFEGEGENVAVVSVDGRTVPGTLQLPDEMLHGAKTVTVTLGDVPAGPRLARSTVRLLNVQETQDAMTYRCQAFGHNQLGFQRVADAVQLSDEQGNPQRCDLDPGEGLKWVTFSGRGIYDLCVRTL